MNVIQYVEKFGGQPFSERPFSDVDAMVLIALVYVNFELVAPDFSVTGREIHLRDIAEEQIAEVCKTRYIPKENEELLRAAIASVRFRDVGVQYVMKVTDVNYLEQFFAVTYTVPTKGYFVVYRGTDSTVTGWKENFIAAVRGVTASQLDAVEYLHLIRRYIGDAPFMIGGHSKGGNLAYYAMLFAPDEIGKNITRAYSLEGTGFPTKEFKERGNYERMFPLMVQIVPQDSLVGELFYTPENHIIVRSDGKGFAQHNMFLWTITEEGDFAYLPRRHFFGQVFHRAVKQCANKGIKEDKELFIDVLVKAFSGKNDEFQIFGAEYGSKVKRIVSTTKREYSKKERWCFYKFVFRLGLYFAGSFFVCAARRMFHRKKNEKKSSTGKTGGEK